MSKNSEAVARHRQVRLKRGSCLWAGCPEMAREGVSRYCLIHGRRLADYQKRRYAEKTDAWRLYKDQLKARVGA